MLELSSDIIQNAVFDELCACLFEPELYMFLLTEVAKFQNPAEIARACFRSRFSAGHDLLYPSSYVKLFKVDSLQQWFTDDNFMFDRCGSVDRQAAFCAGLVFDCAANRHIVVPLSPSAWEAFHDALYPFGDDEEVEIPAREDHLPYFRSPRVGVADEKVRGKAGVDQCAGWNLELSVSLFSDGQVEALSLCHNGTVYIPFGIAAVDVTMLAPVAVFMAAVPRVPYDRIREDAVHREVCWEAD